MGKIAIVFSGQGAQYPGMGKELYESSRAAKAVFDMAESIRPGTLAQCWESDAATLAITANTQPCLFAMDLAVGEALREAGVKADGVAGFSLGELAAAAFSGMLSFEDAFRITVERGKLMQACAEKNPGAMYAVMRMPPEKVEELAAKFEQVYPVNYNFSGQTVVAGSPESLKEFEAAVKSEKGRAIKLKVGGGFHCPFMNDASAEFRKFLDGFTFNEPDIPVYSNVTAQPYSGDPRELLAKQIISPVRWAQSVANMESDGFDTFVEAGAGKTLSDLIKKIGGAEIVTRAENDETLKEALAALGIEG